ncbi:hypothetical protein E2C01_076677 [Portunus trituberculatus]|uniref:Uncharacterized protein n=1 Tax=Portunus trituberculatus TaxID=210409 RepID=A0A5B7IP64_PORTR|nr:hypothetical protein [Portunus trituberculatus]
MTTSPTPHNFLYCINTSTPPPPPPPITGAQAISPWQILLDGTATGNRHHQSDHLTLQLFTRAVVGLAWLGSAWLGLAAASGAAAAAVAAAVRGCSDQRIKYEAADTCQFSDSSPSSAVRSSRSPHLPISSPGVSGARAKERAKADTRDTFTVMDDAERR